MTEQTEDNKALIRRLVDEVFNGGNLDLVDDLYTTDQAAAARDWIGPFLTSFPDLRMDTVELIAEGDTVVGRFMYRHPHRNLARP
jgi:predicted ester cyclase